MEEAPPALVPDDAPPTGGPPKLHDHFDRIFVINCKHRPDRLEEFWKNIEETGVSDDGHIAVYPAIIGDYTGHPAGWGGGRGAWGCLQSHRRLMEDLMHDRDDRGDIQWDQALVLEDDVFFLPSALTGLELLMRDVPQGWGQIYLGGQNRDRITRLESPYVVQCHSVNRTHAYAVSRHSIQQIYHHVSYMADYHSDKHIDHQLELAHQRGDWKVYGPPKWLCGQRAGTSNIGRHNEHDITWD